MARIVYKSWKVGLEKVSLTKLQMSYLGLSLKESKTNVDNLLDGKEISFQINDDVLARAFYSESIKHGVICELFLDK